MSEQILRASDVNIKTSTIEVKTMKTGNHQMTLAVFRQLPEETIFTPYGTLNGIPLGKVNYHVGCKDIAHLKHLHIVWHYPLETELKKAIAMNWLAVSALQGSPYCFHGREDWEDTTRKCWEQTYTRLEQLDQLFIAV